MKNIFFTGILMICANGILFAQFNGKQFISGQAALNFGNNNPKTQQSNNSYGYGFDISFGKFKTDTKASGWRLSNSLGGGKSIYTTYNGQGLGTDVEKSGISGVGLGVGRFWQYYKHFSDKLGIYAGPNVDLTFSNSREYSVNDNNRYLTESKTNKIQISAGVSAGLYYHFSEKWWVTASLAFSNPISVDYSFLSNDPNNGQDTYKTKRLNYQFSPGFNFPNVGLGLRYFL